MALGTVLDKSLPIQIIVVTVVAILATIGVYGIVALIVRMDDFGFKLIEIDNGKNGFRKTIGEVLVSALPKVIKILTVVGTLAMLLVAGGIFMHNVHQLHDILHVVPNMIGELLIGLILGTFSVLIHNLYKKIVH